MLATARVLRARISPDVSIHALLGADPRPIRALGRLPRLASPAGVNKEHIHPYSSCKREQQQRLTPAGGTGGVTCLPDQRGVFNIAA